MKTNEKERRDWVIIILILVLGLFAIFLAGELALRFAPSWELNANVESKIDPNSDFLTHRPDGYIEPVDAAILTNAVWIEMVLTPGVSFSTNAQHPTTDSALPTMPTATTLPVTQTSLPAMVTDTVQALPSPTSSLVYFPPPSSTPKPKRKSKPTVTPTSTPMITATIMQTLTATSTSTTTATLTDTPDPDEPDFGQPDGNTALLGNGVWTEFNLSGFLLDGNSAWDTVYYEQEEASSAGKIHLGAVLIEAYDQTTSSWYTIYNWGDGIVDANASYNNGNSEPDGFPVDMSLLYGTPPLNTGIAIDIDAAAIVQGGAVGDSITKIRITSFSNSECNVDALQMLR